MGANREALETTLGVLGELGRLDLRVDAAVVQVARSLADILDGDSRNSRLWQQYRETLEGLIGDSDDDGSIDDLLAEMRSSVGDSSSS